MKQAVMVTTISAELINIRPDGSAVAKVWPDLPPVEWFVRGPRGGLYQATGERTRWVMQDFARNTWSVIDRSEGVKYVRPAKRAEKGAPRD